MRTGTAGGRARRRSTTEFKAGTVRLVLDEGKTIGSVARDPITAERFTPAPGVHRPRRPQPVSDRTRLSTHPEQARYSTDYAPICGTYIMRGTVV